MVGQTFSLDGVDDHVRIPAASNLNVQSFTIDAWIFPTDLSVGQPIIEYAAETGWAGVHLWLNVPLGGGEGNPGGLQANVRDTSDFGPDGSHELASPPGVVIADQWNHAALTYEKQTGIARLYANGTIVAESHLGTTFTPQTSLPLLFGSRPSGSFDGSAGRYFAGLIDEIAIYHRALTASEIQAIFNAGSAGKCTGVPLTPLAAQATLSISSQAAEDTFALQAAFILGDGSNGIDPLTEAVTVQIGPAALTIPAGAFHRTAIGAFAFAGMREGVTVDITITPLTRATFEVVARGEGATLSGIVVPVPLGLTIGDDHGNTTLPIAEVSARTPPPQR